MAMDFPATPSVGQQFTPPGSSTSWVWDGIAWNIVPEMSPAIISDTPPLNPAVGQFWWRGTNGQLYIWTDDGNSKQWVQATGVASPPGLWEPIRNANGGLRHTFSGVLTYDVKDLGAFQELRWIGIVTPTAQAALNFRTSSDNGVNFYSGASDYTYQYIQGTGATSSASSALATLGYLSNTLDAGAALSFHAEFENFNVATGDKGVRVHSKQRNSGNLSVSVWSNSLNQAPAMNALRLTSTVGTTLSGNFILEGVRS